MTMHRGVYFDAWFPRQHCYHPSLPPRRLGMVGDLVVYRSDASHVGMYMGNGQVIHAPHPGAPVRYDPVGMMPVSSVTRV